MHPPIVQRRIDAAEAVSANLRAAAAECSDRPVVAARHIQASQTIDELVALLNAATFVAKMNHDTVASIAQAYRETVE